MLVAPSARWDAEYGYTLAEKELRQGLAFGCRGALLHGGPLLDTASLLGTIREASQFPFFAAADLTAGVGERFHGATALPPLAALDSNDLDAIRRAVRITAREARAMGINWAIAPSCVQTERVTSIERARTFKGSDAVVGAACAEWLDTCRAEGVIATPGPYPHMRPSTAEAMLDAGVGAIIVEASQATNADVIGYLRNNAGFDGVIIAPLEVMAGAHSMDEEHLAIACLTAGCDLLLGCEDVTSVVRELRRAYDRRAFNAGHIAESCARVERAAMWADVWPGGKEPTLDDALWARRAADAALQLQRGRAHALRSPVDVIVVDDDPARIEPPGTALRETLAKLNHETRDVSDPTPDSRGAVIVALVGDRRIALGFDTFSDGAINRVRDACARAQKMSRDVIVVHFTPPDYSRGLEFAPALVCAWSGTRAMEEAVARWLARAE